MALVGKSGVDDIYEIPDEEVEKARVKGYKQYFDVTKDDKSTFTVSEDDLEKAKSKGYRLFGEPAVEQAEPTPKPLTESKPAKEPQSASWLGRAAESAVEAVKGVPAGLYQLGKEVVTQPAEATLAAVRGTGKTFGVQKVGGALAGTVEAGRALVSGEEVGPAYERGRKEEEERFLEAAEQSKQASPAAYAAGPYAATAAVTGPVGLVPTLAAETVTGAAQQFAEEGEIDTAELAGQAAAGGALMKTASALSKLKPATAAERAAKLERKAVAKAEETAALGDVAEKYTGPGGSEKIRAAKRAPFEAEAAKKRYNQTKVELDNEFNARVAEVQQRNAKLEADYSQRQAQRVEEHNKLIKAIEQERQKVTGKNEDLLADYSNRLEAYNQETKRLEQDYNDAVKQYAIETADLKAKKDHKMKQVDDEYLGRREQFESDLTEWQKQDQQRKEQNAIINQENKLKVAEYRASIQKQVSDYKNMARDLRNQAVQKAKEARRTLRGEAITVMGDEMRNMLNNMEEIQNQAYAARKQAAMVDLDFIDSVDESATSKAIDDVEQVLNTNYMLDDAMREDLKAIKMKVNPELNTQKINRGTDFEALLETRQYLDNVNNDLRLQARAIQRQGGSVPVELTTKRKAIKDARQRIQSSLYGEQSVFSPELKTLGESADNIYADFKNAKAVMQQRGVLSKEKAVPGVESGLEPRTALIESWFDELDAGRKAETRQLLQDFGVDVGRLDLLEEQVRRGVIPEEIALDQLKLPDRPVFAPTIQRAAKPAAPMRPLPSEYLVEGRAPIKPMEPVMPTKPSKPIYQPLPEAPKLVDELKPTKEYVSRERIMAPEEMKTRGEIAGQELLAQEFKGLGGKTAYTPADIPTTQRGLIERGIEFGAEKLGIGQTPMQMLERAAEIRMTPTMLDRIKRAFPQSPRLNAALLALSRQGKVLTPALIRAVARSQGISEEDLESVIAQPPAP